MAKQGSIFNRRPNQFISLDYDQLVDFMYRELVSEQDLPWRDDWKKLFARQMPLYTIVRCAARSLPEQIACRHVAFLAALEGLLEYFVSTDMHVCLLIAVKIRVRSAWAPLPHRRKEGGGP